MAWGARIKQRIFILSFDSVDLRDQQQLFCIETFDRGLLRTHGVYSNLGGFDTFQRFIMPTPYSKRSHNNFKKLFWNLNSVSEVVAFLPQCINLAALPMVRWFSIHPPRRVVEWTTAVDELNCPVSTSSVTSACWRLMQCCGNKRCSDPMTYGSESECANHYAPTLLNLMNIINIMRLRTATSQKKSKSRLLVDGLRLIK